MTARRLATGTIVGAATWSATGYLMFWLVFGNFYTSALESGSAMGVPRDSPLVWAVALGALSYSALLTLAIGNRLDSPAIGAGVKIGVVVGFLAWFTADFMLYGISNVMNVTSTLIAPLLEVVPSAVAGGAIAGALRKVR